MTSEHHTSTGNKMASGSGDQTQHLLDRMRSQAQALAIHYDWQKVNEPINAWTDGS